MSDRSSHPAQLALGPQKRPYTRMLALSVEAQHPHPTIQRLLQHQLRCCSRSDRRFGGGIVSTIAPAPAVRIGSFCPCVYTMLPPFAVAKRRPNFKTLLILSGRTIVLCGINKLSSIPTANGFCSRIVIRPVAICTMTKRIHTACRSGRCSES
jgi:hypothetical protein